MNLRCLFCACLVLLTGTFDPALAEVALTGVKVDGRSLAFSPASSQNHEEPDILRLPASANSIAFQFKNGSNTPIRLRYRLEGVDDNWRDLPSEMVVWIRLLNKDETLIAGETLNLRGESPGWNGHAENTPLSPVRMTVTAPTAAERFRIYFISNGKNPVVGQMVVNPLKISFRKKDGSLVTEQALECKSGQNMNQPYGTPSYWEREGARPELAQVLWREEPTRKPVLFLNDNSVDQFTVWASKIMNLPVQQGDSVSMECVLAYSIGSAENNGTASYENIKPGSYRFRVAAFHHNGLPAGDEVSLPVIIVPPLTQRLSFWFTLLIAIACFVGVTVRWVTLLQNRRQMELLERRRMLEEERNRIARDIHDDLGTTLSQIAMLSEMAKEEKPEGPERQLLGNIFNHAQQATRALDETIWAIRPANDTLGHLIEYLCQFAENHLQLAGLRFRLDVPETIPDFSLTSLERQNLLLATKEALHNVVIHANATEVHLRVRVCGDILSLRIEDNGCGQVPAPDTPPTRGSANMKKRMEQINGRYTRTGIPSQGTVVEFQVQMRRRGREP